MVRYTLVALLACGESGLPTSHPADPTLDLRAEEPPEPQMLVGFFKSGKLDYPPALGALKLGIPEAEARAELARIRDPRFVDPGERQIGEYRIVAATLKDWDMVGISLIVRSESSLLDQIDLAMPGGQALSALTAAFGPALSAKTDEKGRKVHVWVDIEAGLQVELSEADGGRSICKYRQPRE